MNRDPAALSQAHARRFVHGPVWVLVGLVALLAITAYFPFRWDPPHTVANDVRRSQDGVLHFGDQNRARSPGTPQWLDEVRDSGRIRVDLEARSRAQQRHEEISIMMLASDYWHGDFAIGQDGTTMLLWLRRDGAKENGGPPFAVPHAFPPGRWTSVGFIVRGTDLRVLVDGTVRLHEQVGTGSLRTWDGGRITLGNEVDGGFGWHGDIRRAEVRTAGHRIDYARAGALEIPARYLHLPDHVAPFPPPTRQEWLILGLHFLSFIPIGFLIAGMRRPPIPLLYASVLALGISAALAAGKFFFDERHTAAADLVVQYAGALLGAYLAQEWRARARSRSVRRTGERPA